MTRFPGTVVVLTHNRPDLLEVALRSLAAQVLQPEHVVVSDDGDGDAVVELIARCYPEGQVQYRRGPGTGQSDNLRGAMALVTTELVVVLHDDDWWEPDLLAAAARAFASPELHVFIPGIRYVDGAGRDLDAETSARARTRAVALRAVCEVWNDPADRAQRLLIDQTISVFQGTVFRNEILTSWLRGPTRGDVDDLWLCAELARPSAGALSVVYDDRMLCNYRVHGQSVASKINSYMDQSIAAFAAFKDDPDFASVRTALGLRLRERAYQAAILRAAHGARKDAQQLLAQRCPRPRTRNEHILATAVRLPVSGLLRRVLQRRSVRYRVTA